MKKYKVPKKCPYCATELKVEKGLHLYCDNPTCDGTAFKKLVKAVSVLDFDFWGKATIQKIYEAGYDNILEILLGDFSHSELIARGDFKPGKTLDRIVLQVEKLKQIDLWKVICLFSIPNLGETIATQVALKIAGQEYSYKSLQKNIVEMFEDDGLYKLYLDEELERFAEKGIEVMYPIALPSASISEVAGGGTMEMTGSPKPFWKTKAEFVASASGCGFKAGKLTKDSKYLITDNYEAKTSKMKSAEKLGVEIITYQDFKIRYL